MAKKWSELMAKMPVSRRRRVEKGVREDLAEMLLAEIRTMAGLSQQQLAKEIGISQATLSQMERQSDMQITTLQRIVEALGGELEIVAKLPHRRIVVTQFKRRGAA